MAQRAPSRTKGSSLERFKAVPWLLLFEAARLTYTHVTDALPESDRRRAVMIVKRTKGRPQDLTDREREELKRMVRKLDLPGLLRTLGPTAVRARTLRRR